MSERRIVNVFYIERRYFSEDFPEGHSINAVIIDDEMFTVPRADLVNNKVEVRSYPLSFLIESKRQSGIYDADFEERISLLLHEEETNEKKRFDAFRLAQIALSCDGFEEVPDDPFKAIDDGSLAQNPSSNWVLDLCEDSSVRAFSEAINRIIGHKRRIEFLRADRNAHSPMAWRLAICDQKSKIRKALQTVKSISLNPLDPIIKCKLIEEKKRALQVRQEVFANFPLNPRPEGSLRAEAGNSSFVPTPFELELEEFVSILDFICRRFRLFFMERTTRKRHFAVIQGEEMEIDEARIVDSDSPVDDLYWSTMNLASEDPVVERTSEDTDRLAEAMAPLSLSEETPEPRPETGAIPKRRHH